MGVFRFALFVALFVSAMLVRSGEPAYAQNITSDQITILIVPGVGDVADSNFMGVASLDDLIPFPTGNNFAAPAVQTKLADAASIPKEMPLGGILCISPINPDDAKKVSLPRPEGGFPVYLQSLDTATAGSGWFSRWAKKDALPHRIAPELGKPRNVFQSAQAASTVSLIDIGYQDFPQPPQRSSDSPSSEPVTPGVQFARMVNSVLNYNKGAWSGLVLNLSEVSVNRALELIQGIESSLPRERRDHRNGVNNTQRKKG